MFASPTTEPTCTCPACFYPMEPSQKFCGNCGIGPAARISKSTANLLPIPAAPLLVTDQGGLPSFAHVSKGRAFNNNPKLQAEINKTLVLLARERLFLFMHWVLFLVVNLFGFYLSLKCYLEYVGDDVTKLIMASTPLLFINSIALMFIVPIRGTRKQISRLKEQLHLVRFQQEYDYLRKS